MNKTDNLRVHNTLSNKKEVFIPIDRENIKMYVCGPTVYSEAHIGHALSSVVFDIIRRFLEFEGYSVTHIMNFTDVDDKIIERSNREDIDIDLLTNKLIDEYKFQLAQLNVLPASLYPRATEEISFIVDFIKTLVDKDAAYEKNGDVYFRTARYKQYGQLSKRKLENQLRGTRILVESGKDSSEDFALWKSAKKNEIYWDSPWGQGRPGWHIECSAMCLHHLGEQIDIHGGGTDLIFPHHENEIAQTETLTKKQFSKYWLHNGMVEFGGDKMSKSIGNLITIKEFLNKFDSNTFRMMVVSSHYRSPLNYSSELASEASRKWNKVASAFKNAWGSLTEIGRASCRER